MTNDPVLIAYTAKRGTRSAKGRWRRIGCAYPHDVGAGLTVVLDALPVDGRIVLLELGDGDDRELMRMTDLSSNAKLSSTAIKTRS